MKPIVSVSTTKEAFFKLCDKSKTPVTIVIGDVPVDRNIAVRLNGQWENSTGMKSASVVWSSTPLFRPFPGRQQQNLGKVKAAIKKEHAKFLRWFDEWKELRGASAKSPPGRSDGELLQLANEFAGAVYATLGYHVTENYRFDRATHPMERNMWRIAEIAFEHLLQTDLEEVLTNFEGEVAEYESAETGTQEAEDAGSEGTLDHEAVDA